MPKRKHIYPMNGDSVMLKPDPEFNIVMRPRMNDEALFLDEHTVGPLYDALEQIKWPKKELTAHELWEHIRRFGNSINPVTKLPRIIGVLLKLEEMGLKGDIEAIKLFLDRVAGKQPDSVSVNLTKYETLSDRDLLDMVHSDGHQNVVQHQEPSDMASNSQEPEKI